MFQILLVSPSPLYALTVAAALEGPDVSVQNIEPQQCLLELCRHTRFEMIIFLSLAPYFTSMNVVEYLREEVERVPIIYVVSFSHSASTILTLLECGVDQYMTFPVNLYRLRNKVYKQLGEVAL